MRLRHSKLRQECIGMIKIKHKKCSNKMLLMKWKKKLFNKNLSKLLRKENKSLIIIGIVMKTKMQ